MSPEGGRAYTHFAKSKPTLCMSPNGLNFDETTQAPVIRAVNALTKNCTDGYIFSKLNKNVSSYRLLRGLKPHFS